MPSAPSSRVGPRLVAFFAVMYYAGLRPEEAINLAQDNVVLPPRVRNEGNQQWQDPPDERGLGRAAPAQRNPRRRQRVDR